MDKLLKFPSRAEFRLQIGHRTRTLVNVTDHLLESAQALLKLSRHADERVSRAMVHIELARATLFEVRH